MYSVPYSSCHAENQTSNIGDVEDEVREQQCTRDGAEHAFQVAGHTGQQRLVDEGADESCVVNGQAQGSAGHQHDLRSKLEVTVEAIIFQVCRIV